MDQAALKQYLTGIKIIYMTLIMGQIIFSAVIFYMVNSGYSPQMDDFNTIMMLISIVVAVISIFAGNTLFKQKMNAIQSDQMFEDKLKTYRVSLIIKFAVWETSTFVSIIAFFITAYFPIFIAIGVIIVFYFLNNPSLERISAELKLSDSEKEQLYKATDSKVKF